MSETATVDPAELAERFEQFRVAFKELDTEIHRAIVGYDEMLREVLMAVFGGGHVLLEGVPGLGKTFLVKVLSQVLGLDSGRVQCTPDLMPADILGTHIVTDDGTGKKTFVFEKGPVFTNILLVDEINRATPKTQAALLEVMQERHVTAGGEHFDLPSPFFVMATQNPLEMEGTYPLPEAQLDRFMFKLHVPFPGRDALVEISRRTTGYKEPELKVVMSGAQLKEFQELVTEVPVAEPVLRYAASLVLATHPDTKESLPAVKRFVAYGSSPRGMQTLIRSGRVHALLEGRTAVSCEDIRAVALPALRHRVLLNFEGEAESYDVDGLLGEVLDQVPTPGQS
ncbi:MAG TPA: AAA family ATPase [Planctomycetes bacterium]|nr:AAA family ATPase [Planctomycetota bacterium]